MSKINVAIVLDWMGSMGESPEQERDRIMRYLKDDLEPAEINLVGFGTGVDQVTGSAEIDLLIIDYGGVLAGTDAPIWQVGDAVKWAEEHPGKMLYIYTTMTALIYKQEFRDEFGHLENIVYRRSGDIFGEQCIIKVRRWFGMSDEPPIEATELVEPGEPE